MVLQPTGNSGRRSKGENVPPPVYIDARSAAKGRLQASLVERRRVRATDSSSLSPYSTAKYKMDQSKRRRIQSSKPKAKGPMKFKVASPAMDVEMSDGSKSQTVPVSLPRELPRPEYKAVNPEVLAAVEQSSEETDVDYLRECLTTMSPDFMQSLIDTRITTPTDRILESLPVTVTEKVTILPSHVLAIYPSQPATTTSANGEVRKRTKVTLYAVHSLVLAAHCANLPVPPQPLVLPPHQEGQQVANLKVWSLRLPSPDTYPQLSTYLYTKHVPTLMNTILPCPPPASIININVPQSAIEPVDEESLLKPAANSEVVWTYATYLSRTYTQSALMRYVRSVHGLWANACALGVFDSPLFDTIDVMWQAMTTALALATRDEELARIVTPRQTQPVEA